MTNVRLSRATPADAADLIAANVASQAHHLPWVASFTDQAGFDTWFARGLTGPNVGLVAREAASHQVVGIINLNEIVMGAFRSAYLGNDLGLHRLEANIQPDNLASIALVRRVGFRQEGFSPRYLRINGEWRDHERWALLADAAD
jgi:ribosomal-protein-alanine N-acetyltransferase